MVQLIRLCEGRGRRERIMVTHDNILPEQGRSPYNSLSIVARCCILHAIYICVCVYSINQHIDKCCTVKKWSLHVLTVVFVRKRTLRATARYSSLLSFIILHVSSHGRALFPVSFTKVVAFSSLLHTARDPFKSTSLSSRHFQVSS